MKFPPVFGKVDDLDDVLVLLQEECPSHKQQQLARIMQYWSLGMNTMIQVVYD